MAAIDTGNPVSTTQFIVNKYDDIDGSRVNQQTPRGRLCFRDANGRMTLPRNSGEAAKALYPTDWAKPLNPGPYFLNGEGLNGSTLYGFNDGSLGMQETDFALDQDTAFQTPYPAAIGPAYEIPPLFYDLPVPSGAKCLVWDRGTFTYGSGNYVGSAAAYGVSDAVYAATSAGNEGKLTVSGTTAVGFVTQKDVFGPNTITVKLFGSVK